MAFPFNIISNAPVLPRPSPGAHPRPDWLRVKFFGGERYQDLKRIMRTLDLHTVCESARCPNMGECWEHGTATFMILGDICTRACGFCAVPSGKPVGPPDEEEPFRVAEAVERLGLRYAVVTSVNRDDQPDGGAHIFARTIEEIRRRVPGCKVEVLIPDFRGDWNALDAVLAARPDILNHNTETVPRLYRQVRKGAVYERSLELLRRSKEAHPEVPTKTGLMLGLGEERDAGSRRAGYEHPDTGTVFAAHSRAFAYRSLRSPRRVRGIQNPRRDHGVQTRGSRSAGALLISRV